MEANIPAAAGRGRAGNKRIPEGDSSRGVTALRAVRGREPKVRYALGPRTRFEGIPGTEGILPSL